MVGHTQSALCSGGCVSFMLSLSSTLLPQDPSQRARVEENIRRVCEHICSVTVKVVLSLHLCHSLSPCAHTHTHSGSSCHRGRGGRWASVLTLSVFSAGSVSCVATYCTDQVEGEFLVCAVTLTCTLPTV